MFAACPECWTALAFMQISRTIVTGIAGVLCALLAAVFCVLAIYDLFSPWLEASQVLESFGPHHRFCVGISSESSATVAAGQRTLKSNRQRAFILMRAPIGWPRFVAVTQDQDGRVTIDESAFGFWFWLAMTVGIVCGAWRWLVRPLFKGKLLPQPSTGVRNCKQ